MPTIAAADKVNLDSGAKEQLEVISESPIVWHETESSNEDEVITRIGEAEVALTSFNTPMTARVLRACPNLKYVGIGGTNLSNTDREAAAERGIVVKNVTAYGDEGPAEFLIAQLIILARGWGKYPWNTDGMTELNGKTIGLIGMGAVGRQMLKRAMAMDMHVLYYARNRKPEIETEGAEYLSLEELLTRSDVVSLHVPKNVHVLDASQLALMKPRSVLLNTCLGVVVEPDVVKAWLEEGEHFTIMDGSVDHSYHDILENVEGAILDPVISGITRDAEVRLGQKVVDQLRNWLSS